MSDGKRHGLGVSGGSALRLIKRNETYHMRRRVPRRYAKIEDRTWIWISLSTDNEVDARRKALAVWNGFLDTWEARQAGDTSDAEKRYEAARDLAQSRGYRFLPVSRVAQLPLEDLVDRMKAVRTKDGHSDKLEAAAILGGAARPEINMSRALDIFWKIAAPNTRGKSPDQIRRWRNPRVKAFVNFIKIVGDIPLHELTADDMLTFREWWWDRIRDDGLTPNSANKDFTHLGHTLRAVNMHIRLGLNLPLDGYFFSQDEPRIRVAFSEEWIKSNIINRSSLAGLNTEARCVLLGMINTGYRPSEATTLGPDQIRLDTDIPHISIEPNGRTLKTHHSRRVIPLAGISIEAFRSCPTGFPRYFDKPGLSNTINRYMRANGLLESSGHTLYGLRHSFEDRMLDRDVDERIRRDLMGHRLNRQKYGKGASLEKLHSIIQLIAL